MKCNQDFEFIETDDDNKNANVCTHSHTFTILVGDSPWLGVFLRCTLIVEDWAYPQSVHTLMIQPSPSVTFEMVTDTSAWLPCVLLVLSKTHSRDVLGLISHQTSKTLQSWLGISWCTSQDSVTDSPAPTSTVSLHFSDTAGRQKRRGVIYILFFLLLQFQSVFAVCGIFMVQTIYTYLHPMRRCFVDSRLQRRADWDTSTGRTSWKFHCL